MAIELVEVSKNTRGVNSREIKYKAIGKWIEKEVERDTRPAFNDDGTKKLDEKGNEIRLPLEKDKEGKNIYVKEKVQEFTSDGVITDIADALELVNNDEQILLDCFADGFNERAYALEANKDELDEFLSTMALNDEQKSVFKRTARQLNRGTGVDILDAAELIKSMMEKKKAAA
jgi:hypothetical protein